MLSSEWWPPCTVSVRAPSRSTGPWKASSKHRRRGSEDGSGKRLLKRCGPGEAYSTGQARQTKDERGRAGTDRSSTESPGGRQQRRRSKARKKATTIVLENDGRSLKLKIHLWLQTVVVPPCLSPVTGTAAPMAPVSTSVTRQP
jgi:hypothetical protein